ncbi:alpha/beta hydrolase [Pleionea sp. CnH1-48]|uniref:alpha/beta hydrolase n=1 Tax=Pleionea sp. CnH1-48 TaxID=2954494 RepID=UPI002096D582|nr:alpha/beta fold hydrolase [Pleionea sp. CnH1-48]MCO7223584.1 lysophospholipase [Pleionea sp. CnH1-48]
MKNYRNYNLVFWGLMSMAIMLLSGCTSLFLQPDSVKYDTPANYQINFDNLSIPSDEAYLNAWLLKPDQEKKGHVIFFHGNAQNISSHFRSVIWLVEAGYQVLVVDYRGYGQSTGEPKLENMFDDIHHSIVWYQQNYSDELPVYLLGQSLGAATSIYALASNPQLQDYFTAIILEASFASYRQVARELLARSWLTWALQYPLSWTITADYNPEDFIAQLNDKPLLLIHSKDDEIIGFHHAAQLIDKSQCDKVYFLPTHDRHIRSFQHANYRAETLHFLQSGRLESSSLSCKRK